MSLRLAVCLVVLLPSIARAGEPPAREVIQQTVAAVGGEDRLLKLFRIEEQLVLGEKPDGKSSKRISVLEAPNHWWMGKRDRVKQDKEPAIFLVWAWTLGLLVDEKSQLEAVPDVEIDGKKAYGIKVSGTVTPALTMYFDNETRLLSRIDWRSDQHRFSQWKEHDGVKYPAKCTGYKVAGGKAWYHSEIVALERLKELPEGLTRD